MDQIQRFLFDNINVRGEIVRLSDTFDALLSAQPYPESVQVVLGEMAVAASMLVATLKIKGEVSLQVQGNGAVKYALVTASDRQEMRGIARWQEEPLQPGFVDIFKGGIFTITITPENGQRYQGIVAIDKPTLAQCLEAYFVQSEQLPTHIELRVDSNSRQAAGLFLQVIPDSAESSVNKDNAEFEHLTKLAETLKTEELTGLPFEQVLHRLFHEEAVRLFEPQPVQFKCTCSKLKSALALKSVDKQELLSLIEEQGQIKMNCQFCHSVYLYDAMDVEAIHAGTFEQSQAIQ
ncbi:Hsp33 family molecular chaperone HslO [Planctobacterium marinum]|uniref:Hsp33 family molecular chaperone HslO n=1 Tax=Planctobacterium marinum TaxID=1631968 RepID=UPI001E5166B0|nr:Hsp33 family molecular chaperone HslO [Planctobacterium marinum]MCC2606499.1 Hsp33 family molecular chaperone HslO [Planctobacterium marinum]